MTTLEMLVVESRIRLDKNALTSYCVPRAPLSTQQASLVDHVWKGQGCSIFSSQNTVLACHNSTPTNPHYYLCNFWFYYEVRPTDANSPYQNIGLSSGYYAFNPAPRMCLGRQ